MLGPFVPMPLALSLIPTWVRDHAISLLVFGLGEVCGKPCVECSIWGGMVLGNPWLCRPFQLGGENNMRGVCNQIVVSLALGKAHFQGKLRVPFRC